MTTRKRHIQGFVVADVQQNPRSASRIEPRQPRVPCEQLFVRRDQRRAAQACRGGDEAVRGIAMQVGESRSRERNTARRSTTEHAEKHRAALSALQQERAQLGQRLGEVEGALAETRAARDMLSRRLDKAVAAKASKPVAPARKRPASKA